MKLTVVTAALILMVGPVAPGWSTEQSQAAGKFSAEQSRDVEEIVRNYILNHPEVILEAMEKLQAKEQQAQEQQAQRPGFGGKIIRGQDGRPQVSRSEPLVRQGEDVLQFTKLGLYGAPQGGKSFAPNEVCPKVRHHRFSVRK